MVVLEELDGQLTSAPSMEDNGVVAASLASDRKAADGGEKEKLEAADEGEANPERGE